MSGIDLFNILVDSTGIDNNAIRSELLEILDKNNILVEDLNINLLREIMADYLSNNMPVSS